jgi:hypothetical protein
LGNAVIITKGKEESVLQSSVEAVVEDLESIPSLFTLSLSAVSFSQHFSSYNTYDP